jgi:hypothetical protein
MRKVVVLVAVVVLVGLGAFVVFRPQHAKRQTRAQSTGTVGAPLTTVVSASTAPPHPAALELGCGGERWAVKTGTDADRAKVDPTTISTSVAYLAGRPQPSTYPQDERIAPFELHTYEITATVTQYTQAADHDIHMVLHDSQGRSMIAEIPKPSCVGTTSPWRAAIAVARFTWESAYPASSAWRVIHRSVTLRGLGFFDRPEGQTGIARNGIELHPVIYLRLN